MRQAVCLFSVMALVFVATGCQSLHINPSDSAWMKTKKIAARIPVGILTLSLSEQWHTQQRSMEKWVGQSEYALMSALGKPDEVIEGPPGEKTFIYYHNRAYSSAGQYSSYFSRTGAGQYQYNSIYIPPIHQQWTVSRKFFLKDGVVTSYHWQGL